MSETCERLLRSEPQQRVGEPRPFVAAVLVLDDFGRRLHRRAVDRQQHVAAAESPRAAPADPAATSIAVTPSARAPHRTPSSTSCHREYIATFATPSATSTSDDRDREGRPSPDQPAGFDGLGVDQR